MWLKLRKTTSRGRAAMPPTCWRMRRCRRFRRAFRLRRFSIAALLALHLAGAGGGPSRLARFELDPFAGVADALALVGIGRPHRAYARRHLAAQFARRSPPPPCSLPLWGRGRAPPPPRTTPSSFPPARRSYQT